MGELVFVARLFTVVLRWAPAPMLLALATLFGLGLYHGVGPDHCLAIGALASRGGMDRALRVSVQFGVSHSVVLAVCALAATALGFAIPTPWESALEALGGASLFALGTWSVFSARPKGHSHPKSLASVLGAVFSLSGVRGLLLLLPFVMRQRAGLAFVGVSAFGLGVVCSMIVFGWLTTRIATLAPRIEQGLRLSVGVASMVLGSYWVFDHIA